MKALTHYSAMATLMLLLPSCAATPKEEEWNRLGMWHRVENDPPTYVPTGYAASRPRTELDGRWFVDHRDGKRLFVPGAVGARAEGGLLTGEAMKVTCTKRKKSTKSAIEDGTSGFVYGLLMALASMGGAGGGGGSYGGGCHR